MVSMSSACCFFRTTVDGSVISCSSSNWTFWSLSISNTSVNHLQSSYLNIHASLVPITLLSNMLHYTWGSQQHRNLLYIQPWIMVLNDCRGTLLGMLCLLFHGLLVVGASLLLDISSPLADSVALCAHFFPFFDVEALAFGWQECFDFKGGLWDCPVAATFSVTLRGCWDLWGSDILWGVPSSLVFLQWNLIYCLQHVRHVSWLCAVSNTLPTGFRPNRLLPTGCNHKCNRRQLLAYSFSLVHAKSTWYEDQFQSGCGKKRQKKKQTGLDFKTLMTTWSWNRCWCECILGWEEWDGMWILEILKVSKPSLEDTKQEFLSMVHDCVPRKHSLQKTAMRK